MKLNTLSQLIGQRIKSTRRSGIDPATVTEETSGQFEADWKDPDYRYFVISGKSFFSNLNVMLQTTYNFSVTHNQIANFVSKDMLGDDLKNFFLRLEVFRTGV